MDTQTLVHLGDVPEKRTKLKIRTHKNGQCKVWQFMVKCIRSSKKGRIQMSKYPLSKEYVKELNENHYVLKATEWFVSFTAEFKQYAYDEIYKGKSTREIFEQAGFDSSKLGTKRLQNFKANLMKEAEREGGFEDKRKYNYRKEGVSEEAELKKKLSRLEHRLAYLEQENDFLKKITQVEKKCKKK